MFNPHDHNPKTLEEAVELIHESLSQEDRDYILEHGAESAHHGVGTELRNAWLWNAEHPLHIHMKERFNIGHGDDMSGVILRGLDCRVRGVEHDIHAQLRDYNDHWTRYGCDPKTGERV